MRSTSFGAPLDAEIARVGEAIRSSSRAAVLHPSRALDDHAVALATRDAELRTALFRLVDVMPACRTLDDLGHHLASFAGAMDDHGGLRRAAGRATGAKAGRVALGAAVAVGVRQPRTVSSRVKRRSRRAASSAGAGVTGSVLRWIFSARRPSVPRRRTLTPHAARRRSISSHASRARGLRARCSSVIPWVGSRGRTCRSRSLRSRPCCARRRPSAVLPMPRCGCVLCWHAHTVLEHTCTSTWSRWTRWRPRSHWRSSARRGGVPRRPVGRDRVQAYLRESPALVERILAWARRSQRRAPLTVRLVKGAYWDREVAEAEQAGWPVPVFTDKAECDRNFEELTRRLLDARPLVRVAVGSHNLRSITHAIAYNRLTGGRDEDLELQVLRGLGDDLARALGALRMRVRVYYWSAIGRRHGVSGAPPAREHIERVVPRRPGEGHATQGANQEATATSYAAVCANASAARRLRCSRVKPPFSSAASTSG